jgi:lipoprotein-anchoring transpeptidase ErfK/SrfK
MISILGKKPVKSATIEKIIIITASVLLAYLLISLYFRYHYFFHTDINGVNVSLKSHTAADLIIRNKTKDYQLQLIERNGETEIIYGQEIGMHYNENNSISGVERKQKSLRWISSLLKHRDYYVKDLYTYHKEALDKSINGLNCFKREIREPKNVSFVYSNGSYEVEKEDYGNKIEYDKFTKMIEQYVKTGKTILDLDKELCYENPKYTLKSKKTYEARDLLNKYIATKITYKFGDSLVLIDGNIIKDWISVDENLDVAINKAGVSEYVKELSAQYDTVGILRSFKASSGKLIDVQGGLYGWKINQDAETNMIIDNIKRGEVIERDPVYTQKALSRDGNEIGDTYVEINITKQYLWFYYKGKLITQGAVVTGNPNRGNATVIGAYMLNYKQKDTNLVGQDYDVKVTYWMPFFGNMGIHDATWRYRFGGEIYKTRGTHGCVNAPYRLAEKIFEYIEEGTPIIIYEEEKQ